MKIETQVSEQRFFAHEVVQTSAMDCGPAALKSILEGFGIPVSYGRLREACQTDVDGTSIDTIEDIAVQLGLQAEQVMLPVDHLILPEAKALPAVVVVRLPSGLTHFVVIWNRVGKFLQVMDPSAGRRWPTWESFLNEIYIHSFPVPAKNWREWAGSEGLLAPLRRRLSDLKIEEDLIERLVSKALTDPGWRSLGTLDAATRMVTSIVRSKGLLPGKEAGHVLERFYTHSLHVHTPEVDQITLQASDQETPFERLQIPPIYWSVLPLETPKEGDSNNGEPETLILRGAVLVRILGIEESIKPDKDQPAQEGAEQQLPPDLQAALEEPAYRPEQEVWNALREDGLFVPSIIVLALLLATLSVTLEAFLLQGIIQIGEGLSLVSQRIWAALILLAFLIAPLLLEFPVSSSILRMGRRLETRLRVAFLEKIPRLGDKYFRSRLTSDMMQRAHDLRQLRMLPNLGFNLLRTVFQLILTTIGVIWLDPLSAPLAIIGTIFFFGLTFLTRPLLEERDQRLRTHIGALSRFYLDALLGLIPAKTHAAERSFRRQHETHMYEWFRTGREYFNVSMMIQSVGTLLYTVFSVLIVVNYVSQGGEPNEILLLFYWTLSLPTLGQSLALQIQQYPMMRNRVLRVLEPLAAPDEEDIWFHAEEGQAEGSSINSHSENLSIRMEHVWVQAGGNTILEDVSLDVHPGEHIAVVGPSGAGKSSLVGLLLGWHRPAKGKILIDGQMLDGKMIQTLRREIAWVDPAVQIWNRSLYENIRYGMEDQDRVTSIGKVIQEADLYGVLDLLPDGMKTKLGEDGGLVSGGEGQRVRLGRAFYRQDVRLVILDEPFRGLDRDRRRQLLQTALKQWASKTLIFITHDVGETMLFDRVLVIEDGRLIEDGVPKDLAAQPDTRYRAFLDAEDEVRIKIWESADWRRMILQDGKLHFEDEE
jgi:ABC-type bacteriocin/lantibiotic exporter with double-glycine peptidase domain